MPEELSFEIDGLHIAAQGWGEPDGMPILALHGWLDNCASFYALAPQLTGVYIVAMDMAGHGQSGHRPGSLPYNIWDDVAEIFAVADQLGWSEFALLGHSRGAIIAMLAAGTFPSRITHLGLIEGLLPEPGQIEDAPAQLAASIKAMRSLRDKPMTCYPELESAIEARARGMFPLSYTAADAITRRGTTAVSDGYIWSSDQRLLAPSAIKLTRGQIEAFIGRITAPTKLILAQDGIPKRFANYQREVSAFPNVEVTHLGGGHHLHMEKEVGDVANALNHFFTFTT